MRDAENRWLESVFYLIKELKVPLGCNAQMIYAYTNYVYVGDCFGQKCKGTEGFWVFLMAECQPWL